MHINLEGIDNYICLILDSSMGRVASGSICLDRSLGLWGESITIVRIDGREALSLKGRM